MQRCFAKYARFDYTRHASTRPSDAAGPSVLAPQCWLLIRRPPIGLRRPLDPLHSQDRAPLGDEQRDAKYERDGGPDLQQPQPESVSCPLALWFGVSRTGGGRGFGGFRVLGLGLGRVNAPVSEAASSS